MRQLKAGGLGFTVASTIVLVAIAFRPVDDPRSMLRVSHLPVALHVGAALITLWVAAGRSARWVRALGLFGGALAVLAWFSVFGEWPDYWYLLVAAAVQVSALLISVPLLRAIRAGERRVGCLEPRGPVAPQSGSYRLSIRDLLLSVAAIAVLLTPLSSMRPFVHHGQVPAHVIHGLALALVSLATACVTSGRSIGPASLLVLVFSLVIGVASEAFVYGQIFQTTNYRIFIGEISYNLVMHSALLFVPLRFFALLEPKSARTESGSHG